MIEQYVLDELKKYKDENEKLKEEIYNLKNKFVVMVDETPKRGELKPIEVIISILKENNVEPKKIVDEMGSNEIRDLIINLGLYKEKLPAKSNSSSREYDTAIVRVGKKYYAMESYYNDYKLEDEIYTTWEDEVYYELCDELWTRIDTYLRNLKIAEENKEKNNK